MPFFSKKTLYALTFTLNVPKTSLTVTGRIRLKMFGLFLLLCTQPRITKVHFHEPPSTRERFIDKPTLLWTVRIDVQIVENAPCLYVCLPGNTAWPD